MHKFTGIIVLIFLATALSACSFSTVSDITPPPGSEQGPLQSSMQSAKVTSVYPIVPPDLADGERIYQQECAECHGDQGLGDGPQVSQLSVPAATLGLSDLARLYSPADWYTIVTQGNMEKFMPAFSNLSDRQRWDVVAYAMSLSVPDEQVAQGNLLYQENCTICHGPTGSGNGSASGDLATAPTDLTQQSFMVRKSATNLYQAISTGVSPDMPAFADKLTEDERWALVGYLRTLSYASQQASLAAYPAPALTPISTSAPDSYPPPQGYPAPTLSQSALISPTSEISSTATFTGSVAVQLINGSGGSTPSDVPVTLYGFDDMQNTYSATLTTGANGLYTFSNINMPEGRVFMAGANYASSVYGSDIVTVNPATPELNLQITVYDTTTDISALTADRLHILFDFSQPDVAQVIEVFIISNPSKQAVVSANQDHTVVTFPLPAGYSNLQFQDGTLGGRYIEVKQGFADTSTVSPGVGDYTVIFAFQMPYNRKLDFVQPISLPTSAVVVMVPEKGVKVISDHLQDGGTLDYKDLTYHKYDGSGLIAGSSLEFTLSGNPNNASAATLFSPGTGQSLAIGLGVFGVALLATGFWLYRRNQVRLAAQPFAGDVLLSEAESQVDVALEDEDTLMDAIIALDDQYNAGNLPEEAYLERRSVLKAKLRNISRE
jgi:mono/diheme cytochrome c family protein